VQQGIVDTAQRQGCDLIVMATHGRHGLDALIHGSLAKSVLAHSKLPLLILH
jgi:nucleotide-binding universal stress UspA family protein